MRGFSLGIVDNSSPTLNLTGSDCYKDTNVLANKIVLIYQSIIGVTVKTIVTPLMYTNQLFVDLSHSLESCASLTMISQFTARTSNLSGLFGFLFTLAYDIYSNGTAFSAVLDIIGMQSSCIQVGTGIGTITS